MYELNEKVRSLTPYEPISGKYPVRLDANESFLSLPEELREEIGRAVSRAAFQRYPDPLAGKVTEAFADFYGISPSLVTVGNGSDELLYLLTSTMLMRGESMLVLEPDFSMYRFYGSLSEVEVVSCPKREDLTIDVDEVIRRAKEANARLILFSNPCNPTSLGLPRQEVRRLVRSVEALVVLDEAYMDFWDQSLLPQVEEYENLVILRTCSKALGLASLRLGFAVANRRLTAALRAVKSPYNVNSLSQTAGALVLREKEWASYALGQILASRDELQAALDSLAAEFPGQLQVYRSCTNFIFLKPAGAAGLFEGLLEAGVAVRRMGEFLRVTAGSQEENRRFLEAFRSLFREGRAAE